MYRRTLLEGLGVATLMTALPGLASGAPVNANGLGQGPFSRLHVYLEKTFLNIDVVSLEIRVDQATADKLEQLVKGRERTTALERTIVSTVLGTSGAYSALKFLRGFTREDFIEGVRVDVGRAYKGKLIERAEYERIFRGMPGWFAFLGERGIEEGDRLFHRGGTDGLRTVFVESGGRTRMDMTQPSKQPTRSLLASFLAPGGELRGPLVQSLFDQPEARKRGAPGA
jgi:hypothetical protein